MSTVNTDIIIFAVMGFHPVHSGGLIRAWKPDAVLTTMTNMSFACCVQDSRYITVPMNVR